MSDHEPSGAGALAADTIALAADLCVSLARGASDRWQDGRGVATQAAHLSSRAASAREENVRAYTRARRVLHGPTPPTSSAALQAPAAATPGRDGLLRAALLASADTLLVVEAAAADTAQLAAMIAANVEPSLRPDALGAAEIAAGAAAAAAQLVAVNLALNPDDPRRQRAATLLEAARQSCRVAHQALLD